jgi:hypothetical protein
MALAVTTLAITEAALAVLISSHTPITIILVIALALGITVTAAAATITVVAGLLILLVGLHATSLDVIDLLLAVLLLTHDLQILALELRLGIELKELLSGLLAIELDEDTSLESLVIVTTKTHSVRGAVLAEEGLNVELSAGSLFAKALSIDGTRHSTVFEDLDSLGVGAVIKFGRQRLFAAHAGVIFAEIEEGRLTQRLDDGIERLEVAHALERVQNLDLDGIVLASADLLEKELVSGQVAVGEVEFDLARVSRAKEASDPFNGPACG